MLRMFTLRDLKVDFASHGSKLCLISLVLKFQTLWSKRIGDVFAFVIFG